MVAGPGWLAEALPQLLVTLGVALRGAEIIDSALEQPAAILKGLRPGRSGGGTGCTKEGAVAEEQVADAKPGKWHPHLPVTSAKAATLPVQQD